MVAVLKITDGTTTIDLLNDHSGFMLKEWEPTVPDYKGGGVWQDSPLADGKVLSDKRFDVYTDTFVLMARGPTQNKLIDYMRTLRNMLEQAANFWVVDWNSEPVWIEAKASCEDETRYALIN